MNIEDPEVLIGMEPPPRNTARIPLPESSTIRKSSFGRAVLWVEDAQYQEMHCSSSITQQTQEGRIYHSHSLNQRSPEDWQKRTDVACWHCCHGFETPPVAIPRTYDTKERKYVVYGNFCSLRCAKGYLVDNPTFESSQNMNMFAKMARDLYGCTSVQPAPPRITLRMFGGCYDIAQFRSDDLHAIVQTPPFITSYMVIEERQKVSNASAYHAATNGSIRGLRKPTTQVEMIHPDPIPPEEAPYNIFLSQHGQKGGATTLLSATAPSQTHAAAPSSARAATKKASSAPKANGTLNAFMIP